MRSKARTTTSLMWLRARAASKAGCGHVWPVVVGCDKIWKVLSWFGGHTWPYVLALAISHLCHLVPGTRLCQTFSEGLSHAQPLACSRTPPLVRARSLPPPGLRKARVGKDELQWPHRRDGGKEARRSSFANEIIWNQMNSEIFWVSGWNTPCSSTQPCTYPRALELALADWIRLALSDTETHWNVACIWLIHQPTG
jgi:hypothetical protein